MRGANRREAAIPRFALRRDEVATSLAISPSLFDTWIGKGRMPSGYKIDGVVLWDAEEVKAAWSRIVGRRGSSDDDDDGNPYDRIVP